MPIKTLESLFTIQLKDIYDAEKRLTKALPKMAKSAVSEELSNAFHEHLAVTRNHVARLEEVFHLLVMRPQAKTCEAMKGLIEEGGEAMSESGLEPLFDLNLVGAARRVEHYEMAAYKSLIALSQGLENGREVETLLSQTLREEQEADEALSRLAENLVEEANSEGDQEGDGKEADKRQPALSSRH